MKNTRTNLATLSEIAAACEGTRWEFRYSVSNESDRVYAQLITRRDAPEYTPNMYFKENWENCDHIQIEIQTIGYGALSIPQIAKVAEGLTEAAQLGNRIRLIAELAGFRVFGIGCL